LKIDNIENMKILFIQTGGTIDKDYPRTTAGYSFEITTPAVQRILENINPSFEYEILPLMQKDSLDLRDDDRKTIYDACLNSDCKKIIITHGTDTMIETTKLLNSIKGKVIVLTGAKLPERFTNSDARFNIGVAVGVLNTTEEGVFIAMSGRVFDCNKVKLDKITGKFIDA
jgi:L-asparaginase